MWIRIWHATNAIMILILIITGVSMQYSSPERAFIRFDIAVSMHNISGIILTLNYVLFVAGNAITSNGKFYRIQFKGLVGRLKKQFMYYTFGIFKQQSPPFPVSNKNKFNPLQQFTYIGTMYVLVPIVIFTGLALLYPELILTKILGGSGLKINVFLHVIIGFLISFFMFIHIYFCTIGATFVSNFKSMINGFHESHD